ncbi:MAG: DUF481 domain-containing protein [Pseudomonadota bacterium]
MQRTPTPKARLQSTLVAVAALCASAASADVLLLDNGDRITGTVDNITAGSVTVTTAYAGAIVVNMDNVVELSTEGEYDVTLASGDSFTGSVVRDGLLVDGSVVPAKATDISLLAVIDDGSPVWDSRLDLLATRSNGNSKVQTINLFGESRYTHGPNDHFLSFAWGDEEAEGETTKAQLEIDYNYRRILQNNWYWAGNVEYFQDDLKGVDRRITVGVAAGKLWWDTAISRLSTEIGVSQVFEKLEGELGNESNPALRWGLDYTRLLRGNLDFFHNHDILAILGGGRGQVFDSSTGVRFALTDAVQASLRVDFRHETDPPEDAHRSDVTYGLGIGYVF